MTQKNVLEDTDNCWPRYAASLELMTSQERFRIISNSFTETANGTICNNINDTEHNDSNGTIIHHGMATQLLSSLGQT